MSCRLRVLLRSCIKFSIVVIFASLIAMLIAAVMRSHMLTASHFNHEKTEYREPVKQDRALGIGDMYSDDPEKRYNVALNIYETNLQEDEFILIKYTDAGEGNFPCSQSIVEGSCAFYVDTLQEAKHICLLYKHFCIGFVLTSEMVVHLKRTILRTFVSEKASLFLLKDSFDELQGVMDPVNKIQTIASTERTFLKTLRVTTG